MHGAGERFKKHGTEQQKKARGQAEITTKAQNVSERLAFVEEFIKQQHAQAHEAGMQAQDHAHDGALTKQQQDADSMSQAVEQAHQMGMAQVQQPPVGES